MKIKIWNQKGFVKSLLTGWIISIVVGLIVSLVVVILFGEVEDYSKWIIVCIVICIIATPIYILGIQQFNSLSAIILMNIVLMTIITILFALNDGHFLRYLVLFNLIGISVLPIPISMIGINKNNYQISNVNKPRKWNYKEISDFLNGVKTGRIIPSSSGHTIYKDGRPMTCFSFPDYGCEIHVHWKDEKREDMSVAHIKDMFETEAKEDAYITKIVDTQTIAMLRHFSGLDNIKG